MSRDTGPSWTLPQEDIVRFSDEFPGLYSLGCHLCETALDASLDQDVGIALCSGADRFALTLTDWLKSAETSDQPETCATLDWLRRLDSAAAIGMVREVVDAAILGRDTNYLEVLAQAEAEIADYGAFLAMGQAIEAASMDLMTPRILADAERFGAVVAGLAVARSLEAEAAGSPVAL